MDTGLLEQLMIKPIPKKQAQVQIILPGKGEVALPSSLVSPPYESSFIDVKTMLLSGVPEALSVPLTYK